MHKINSELNALLFPNSLGIWLMHVVVVNAGGETWKHCVATTGSVEN